MVREIFLPQRRDDFLPEIRATQEEINSYLKEECGRILEIPIPFQLGHALATIRKDELETWYHSIVVGFLCEALYQEFYDVPLLVGRVCGELHDIGKARIFPKVHLKDEKLTPKERELIKDHPYYSYMIVAGAGFPYVAQIIGCHHLYGQKDPYPEHYTEANPYFKKLQLTLALADKFAARTEGRPELSEREQTRRMAVISETVAALKDSFSEAPQVSEQIEFLGENHFNITPLPIPRVLEKEALIPLDNF